MVDVRIRRLVACEYSRTREKLIRSAAHATLRKFGSTVPNSADCGGNYLQPKMPLRIYRPNDRVIYRERLATVRYVGMTLWCDVESEWVGLEFDAPVGKHDGEVRGTRYFNATPSHGLFVRRIHIRPVGVASDLRIPQEMVQARSPICSQRGTETGRLDLRRPGGVGSAISSPATPRASALQALEHERRRERGSSGGSSRHLQATLDQAQAALDASARRRSKLSRSASFAPRSASSPPSDSRMATPVSPPRFDRLSSSPATLMGSLDSPGSSSSGTPNTAMSHATTTAAAAAAARTVATPPTAPPTKEMAGLAVSPPLVNGGGGGGGGGKSGSGGKQQQQRNGRGGSPSSSPEEMAAATRALDGFALSGGELTMLRTRVHADAGAGAGAGAGAATAEAAGGRRDPAAAGTTLAEAGSPRRPVSARPRPTQDAHAASATATAGADVWRDAPSWSRKELIARIIQGDWPPPELTAG